MILNYATSQHFKINQFLKKIVVRKTLTKFNGKANWFLQSLFPLFFKKTQIPFLKGHLVLLGWKSNWILQLFSTYEYFSSPENQFFLSFNYFHQFTDLSNAMFPNLFHSKEPTICFRNPWRSWIYLGKPPSQLKKILVRLISYKIFKAIMKCIELKKKVAYFYNNWIYYFRVLENPVEFGNKLGSNELILGNIKRIKSMECSTMVV